MAGAIYELRLFFREFRDTFDSTGAILPSGRMLARALSEFVRNRPAAGEPRRILEVGPGTGAVTQEIVRLLRPGDRLELVELNTRFVEHLRRKLAEHPRFVPVANQVHLIHAAVQELPADTRYDAIISGLPLNNFPPKLVREILEKLRDLLAPGGTLSFFEYIAIRRAKAVVSRRSERLRLERIGTILHDLLKDHEVRRDRVLRNVPPAWVHHVRFDADRVDRGTSIAETSPTNIKIAVAGSGAAPPEGIESPQ